MTIDLRRSKQCRFCDTEGKYAINIHINMVSPGLVQPVHGAKNREIITTTLMESGQYQGEPDFLTARVELVPIQASVIEAAGPVATCDRGECTKIAAYQIEQRFRMMWQKRTEKPQIKALTNLCVCEEHMSQVKAEDFMDRQSEKITRAMLNSRGISMPDYKTMEIGFVALHNGRKANPVVWTGPDQPADMKAVALRKRG
jgi:hypothetical protein